ncbi:MAG TPA: hypothetical protein VIU13_20075 [Chryseolinea sp.]
MKVSIHTFLKVSSTALAVSSDDYTNGMGFANSITTGELFREGSNSVHTDFK